MAVVIFKCIFNQIQCSLATSDPICVDHCKSKLQNCKCIANSGSDVAGCKQQHIPCADWYFVKYAIL